MEGIEKAMNQVISERKERKLSQAAYELAQTIRSRNTPLVHEDLYAELEGHLREILGKDAFEKYFHELNLGKLAADPETDISEVISRASESAPVLVATNITRDSETAMRVLHELSNEGGKKVIFVSKTRPPCGNEFARQLRHTIPMGFERRS